MKTIKLTSNELIPFLNILNEVCHGINVRDFEDTIGTQRKSVVDFIDMLLEKKDEDQVILLVNDFELKFIQKSFQEVFRQIEEWEFETRIGITIPEANKIKEKILTHSTFN